MCDLASVLLQMLFLTKHLPACGTSTWKHWRVPPCGCSHLLHLEVPDNLLAKDQPGPTLLSFWDQTGLGVPRVFTIKKCFLLPLHVPPLCSAKGNNAFLCKSVQRQWVNALQNTKKTQALLNIYIKLLFSFYSLDDRNYSDLLNTCRRGERPSNAEVQIRVTVAQIQETRESHSSIPGCSLCTQHV